MGGPLLVALVIAVMSSIVSPVVVALLARRHRQEDWDRQDKVAERLEQTNQQVARAAEESRFKMDEIHILVNSNLTAALEAQLEATRAQLVWMEASKTATSESVETIRMKISTLEANLTERARQLHIAEAARLKEKQRNEDKDAL